MTNKGLMVKHSFAQYLVKCLLFILQDKHHQFLQEMQALDPEVHDLITDNLNVSQSKLLYV